jgi:hypothetical protein
MSASAHRSMTCTARREQGEKAKEVTGMKPYIANGELRQSHFQRV